MFNARSTVLNANGTTSMFASELRSFATIPNITSWGLLANGVDVSDLYEDMNGDGLADLVVIDVGNLPYQVTYLPGQGDGNVGACPNGERVCAGSDRLNQSQLIYMDNSTFPLPRAAVKNVYVHDINGDGLADALVGENGGYFEVLLNHNGKAFGSPIQLPVAGYDPTKSRVMFADMNGSGVDDLVVITDNYATYVDLLNGVRPGLLTQIDNGRHATTTLDYASTIDLAQCSRGAPGCAATPSGGRPWVSQTPQVMHVVTKLSTTNNLAAPLAVNSVTEYGYGDPVYDGRRTSSEGARG
jgi:Insecticide toxin TcdB middle/N-terminal region